MHIYIPNSSGIRVTPSDYGSSGCGSTDCGSSRSRSFHSGSASNGYIPKHKRDLLDLIYSANHSLEEIWKLTAQYERDEKTTKATKQKEISSNLQHLKEIQQSLKPEIDKRIMGQNHWSKELADLYLAYGKSQYLEAKMYEFQGKTFKEVEAIYTSAQQSFVFAGSIFRAVKDVQGEIISSEYLSIVEDQFCKVRDESDKQHHPEMVINSLKSLVKKLDLNHKSYHVGFEITAHILSLLFAPLIGGLELAAIGFIRGSREPESPHKRNNISENTSFKNKIHEIKTHLTHGASELVPLSLGYLSAFVVLETFIKQNLATFLLHQIPLASLPKPISGFGLWILKLLYDSNELKELFLMKANIHHDLMKGYDNLVEHNHQKGNYATQKNLINAQRNEKISKFFYREYIKTLDPLVDAQEIADIQEYMQR